VSQYPRRSASNGATRPRRPRRCCCGSIASRGTTAWPRAARSGRGIVAHYTRAPRGPPAAGPLGRARGAVDAERHEHVRAKLRIQVDDAEAWRDHCLTYFQQFSQGRFRISGRPTRAQGPRAKGPRGPRGHGTGTLGFAGSDHAERHRLAPRHRHRRTRAGEPRLLRGRARHAARQAQRQPGRRRHLSPLLRRCRGTPGHRPHLLPVGAPGPRTRGARAHRGGVARRAAGEPGVLERAAHALRRGARTRDPVRRPRRCRSWTRTGCAWRSWSAPTRCGA
jgi:hypothetical protein